MEEYGYDRLCRDIGLLRRKYGFVTVSEVGRSVCGRSLFLIRIGSGETGALYAGTFHGMERITAHVLMLFTEALCKKVTEQSTFLAGKAVYLMPMVNPDGAEIAIGGAEKAGAYGKFVSAWGSETKLWQANARGVDLNHNFNAGWYALRRMEIREGYVRPGPTRFGGYYPESEPESECIAQLCRKIRFTHAVAFHSQGEEIYYSYKGYTPPGGFAKAQELSKSSGYRLSGAEGIAAAGGFKDWFICAFDRPGFTFEVGLGKNPLAPDEIEKIYPKLQKTLFEGIVINC